MIVRDHYSPLLGPYVIGPLFFFANLSVDIDSQPIFFQEVDIDYQPIFFCMNRPGWSISTDFRTLSIEQTINIDWKPANWVRILPQMFMFLYRHNENRFFTYIGSYTLIGSHMSAFMYAPGHHWPNKSKMQLLDHTKNVDITTEIRPDTRKFSFCIAPLEYTPY